MQIKHLVSDRYGGVSAPPYDELNIALHVGDDPKAVERNRAILYQKAGITKAQFANQVHGDTILILNRFCEPAPSCDGFITQQAGLPLAIMSADCFGVLLYDKDAHVIAALHAGRAGASRGIVAKGLALMQQRFGARHIEALISPGIHSCCYEIAPELAASYPKKFVYRGSFLDIKAMIYEQLRDGRVGQIHDYAICTCCNEGYYSYRREKRTGRFASIIWIEEE